MCNYELNMSFINLGPGILTLVLVLSVHKGTCTLYHIGE